MADERAITPDYVAELVDQITTPAEFAEVIIHLPSEQQNAFYEELKAQLCEEDLKSVVLFISAHGLFRSTAKYEALKKATKSTLIEYFFGHPYEEPENQCFDPCNPVHMFSINSMPM